MILSRSSTVSGGTFVEVEESWRGFRIKSTAEDVRSHSVGAASRNNGTFESVQYRNGPTFLIPLVRRALFHGEQLTSSVIEPRQRWMESHHCTMVFDLQEVCQHSTL